MDLKDLETLFEKARTLSGLTEYVVVGSLCALGVVKNGIKAYFLDPNDAAVSKYARSERRDREWIRAGLAAGLLSAAMIESRFRDTPFLDAEEERRARAALAEDTAR